VVLFIYLVNTVVDEQVHRVTVCMSYCWWKFPVKLSPPTNQGQMLFVSLNEQCRSTEGKSITFHGLWEWLPSFSSALWWQYSIRWSDDTVQNNIVILQQLLCGERVFLVHGLANVVLCCRKYVINRRIVTTEAYFTSPSS